MISQLFNSDNHLITSLVWTLIHSLWQFTIVGLCMSFLLKIFEHKKPFIKYYISLGSLFLSFGIAVFTFIYFYIDTSGQQSLIQLSGFISSQDIASTQGGFLDMVQHGIEKYQFPIFITWVGGVTLFGLKFLLSIAYVEFLSSTSQAMYCQDTYRAFRRVSKHYRVNQNISIGESKYVKTPMILGFFKPVILFPIGLVNQLDISETEAILAHELAHFTRKDIYINIVQTMIEIVLYYHPAIWWISANIRLERESCCDELAIHYTGNNIHYAKTLVKIQEINQASNQPSLALYFNKKESFFSNRIKRILNMTQTRNYLKEKIITSVVLVVVILFATRDLTGNTNKVTIEGNTSTQKTIAATISFDTIPNQKEKVQIQKKSDTQDYKISMEDGKVIEL